MGSVTKDQLLAGILPLDQLFDGFMPSKGSVSEDQERRRTGPGEIVPRSVEQQEARLAFLEALRRLAPEACRLFTGDLERRRIMVREWQAKYRLWDHWIPDYFMLGTQSADLNEGRIYWDPDREGPRRYVLRAGKTPHRRGGYSVALSELHERYELEDGTLSDDDFDTIGMFDPRRETEDEAVARMLPELERRLRSVLRQTAEEDAALCEAVRARTLPPARHFEWTVRYQVLGDSIATIAASEGKLDRTISKGVRAVAELIGLTLREPSKGGRPRKPRPARNARCIAIRHEKPPR